MEKSLADTVRTLAKTIGVVSVSVERDTGPGESRWGYRTRVPFNSGVATVDFGVDKAERPAVRRAFDAVMDGGEVTGVEASLDCEESPGGYTRATIYVPDFEKFAAVAG